MSSPLATIAPEAFAFEAVLEMTRRDVHHLPVVEAGRRVGVISSHDLFRLHAVHPVQLGRAVERADSLAGLRDLAGRTVVLVRQLWHDGGTAYDIGQMVAELNDRIVTRVVALAGETVRAAGAEPPVPWCWLAFGSEGRREQTLRTDQDNGLVYGDPAPAQAAAAAASFARFAGEVTRGLIAVGFPPCPGEIMGSNPRWCRPVSDWAGYFRAWMAEQTPAHVLAASIFFDLRPVAGTLGLGAALAELVAREAPAQTLFLRRLAEDVATSRLPVTWLGRIAVERAGSRRGTVDVKRGGAFQLVGAGRVHALALGLAETNTVDRFRAAAARGVYTATAARDVTDAYQHLMRVRIGHQLRQLEQGQEADNHLSPAELSRADAVLFREALRTVGQVQAEIGERYGVRLLR
jgi:CBS domain-containing protein